MNITILLINFSHIFQTIFQHINKNSQLIGHKCSFLKLLKDKTSPLVETARKGYIFKFRYIELAMVGDIHSKILEQYS